jgi:hypothetical protein
MYGPRHETRTAKEQAKSGLRLGLGFASLFVGGGLLGAGLSSTVWAARSAHQIVRLDPIGWLEVIVGTAILIPSAGVWWQLLVGYMLFAAAKSLLLLVTGADPYPPHGAISRLTSTALLCYCIASIALMVRFVKHAPSVIDRVALTLFLVALLWRADTMKVSGLGPGLIGGPILLLAAQWASDLARKRKAEHQGKSGTA